MVYYSNSAKTDIDNMIIGLLEWSTANGQVHLEFDTVMKYIDDMKNAFDCIDQLPTMHRYDMPHMPNMANTPILTNGINAQHGTAFIIFMPPMRS